VSGPRRLKFLIFPPLAFARLGNSDVPLDAYYWGPNDNTPNGTGKTTIVPAPTLHVSDDDGTVSCVTPVSVQFKDAKGFRPVCPFFELWGQWGERDDERSAITPELLQRFGLAESQLVWTVEVANLKPYFMTRDWQTRIHARVDLRGGDVQKHALQGTAPTGAPNPLVPHGRQIPFGTVRLTRPNRDFPEFRLRFTPGTGRFFGPTDLPQRWTVKLVKEDLILNPSSSWCGWKPSRDDPRGWPPGQYAQTEEGGISHGLVDDVCDGIITCTIGQAPGDLTIEPARARIVVGPPDYAPDRRPVVSLADGLKDRVERALPADYFKDMAAVRRENGDLLERVIETLGLMNLDVFNNVIGTRENALIALQQGMPPRRDNLYVFPPIEPTDKHPFPLTELGRQHHRRYADIDVFEDYVRKHPDVIERLVRPPLSPDLFFDSRMPALMKDASGTPLHLTRRQYDVLIQWARELRERAETSEGGQS
jgi:hypothetical protein